MRTFTDKEIFERIKSLPSFKGYPDFLLVGIRSKVDTFNQFDDKFFFYMDGEFYAMTTGTTNPGDKSLLFPSNSKGSAIVKSNEIYYDVYRYGLHKQKMPALRQVANMKYFRDNNRDKKVDESGQVYEENAYTNFHFNDYNILSKIKRIFIGGWSEGCQVANNSEGYNKIISYVKSSNKPVTYALLKEW